MALQYLVPRQVSIRRGIEGFRRLSEHKKPIIVAEVVHAVQNVYEGDRPRFGPPLKNDFLHCLDDEAFPDEPMADWIAQRLDPAEATELIPERYSVVVGDRVAGIAGSPSTVCLTVEMAGAVW